MLFHLQLEFGKCRFHAATDVAANTGRMKRPGWQCEVRGKIVLRLPRRFFERSVEDHQVRSISFQQPVQFLNMMLRFFLDLLAKSRFDMTVGDFHSGTLSRTGLPQEGSWA